MTPAERAMPTVTVVEVEGYGWLVALPGERKRLCADKAEALEVIDHEASGSAVRWIDAERPAVVLSAGAQTNAD